MEANKPLIPDPYTIVKHVELTEIDVHHSSASIPWENKEFKLHWRGLNEDSSLDLSDDCLVDAYNGKLARLGIILEGVENRDFIDSRFSKSYYSSETKGSCIEKILEKYGSSNVALRMHHLHVSDKISKR